MPKRKVSKFQIPNSKLLCLPLVAGFFFFVFSVALPCLQIAQAKEPQPSATSQQEYVPANQNYDTFLKNVERANRTGVQNVDSQYVLVFDRVILTMTRLLGGNLASSDPQVQGTETGLIGVASTVMSGMYHYQPASGIAYVKDLSESSGLVPKAYAQSEQQGFNKLYPLSKLWAAMRNLAYILYIPIFIFIGITIMLRQKINPQTVASVQGAIPKIILSLVLVTFSFAIAGFMIDIMNYSMSVVVNYFIDQRFIDGVNFQNNKDNIYSQNLFGFVKNKFDIDNFADVPAEAIGQFVAKITKGVTDATRIPGINQFLGGTVGALANLIFLGAMVFVLFRVIFTLILAYIGIIGLTVMAPLILVFDAIPGRSGFGFWFRSMLSNLVVFPAVLALLLFAAVVGGVDTVIGDNQIKFQDQNGWVPPFLGAFAGDNIKTFGRFFAFGAVLMMPTMLAQAQKFLKTGINLGPLLEPVSAAAAPVMGGLQSAGKIAYDRSPIGQFTIGQREKARYAAQQKYGAPDLARIAQRETTAGGGTQT